MTTRKRSDNFRFKIFSQYLYMCYVILMSGRARKKQRSQYIFLVLLIQSFEATWNETKRNETSLVSWLKWWPVSNTSFLCCCRCCWCFCCLILFSWRIFFFFVFRLIQFYAFDAIVVVVVQEREIVSPFRFGGKFIFFINFHSTYICNMSHWYGPAVVWCKCFYCCTDFSMYHWSR